TVIRDSPMSTTVPSGPRWPTGRHPGGRTRAAAAGTSPEGTRERGCPRAARLPSAAMSTVRVRRATRCPAPPVPDDPVEVAAPPAAPRPPTSARYTRPLLALPLLGGAVATALVVSQGTGPQTWLVGGLL